MHVVGEVKFPDYYVYKCFFTAMARDGGASLISVGMDGRESCPCGSVYVIFRQRGENIIDRRADDRAHSLSGVPIQGFEQHPFTSGSAAKTRSAWSALTR